MSARTFCTFPPTMPIPKFLEVYCGDRITPEDAGSVPPIHLDHTSTSEMCKKGPYHHALATLQKIHIPLIWSIADLKFSIMNVRMVRLNFLNPPFCDERNKSRPEMRGIYLQDTQCALNNGSAESHKPIRNHGSVVIGKGRPLCWSDFAPILAVKAAQEVSNRSTASLDDREKQVYGMYLAISKDRESFVFPTDVIEHINSLRVVFVDETITEDWTAMLLLPCSGTVIKTFPKKIYCPKGMTFSTSASKSPALAPFLATLPQCSLPNSALKVLLNYIFDDRKSLECPLAEFAKIAVDISNLTATSMVPNSPVQPHSSTPPDPASIGTKV